MPPSVEAPPIVRHDAARLCSSLWVHEVAVEVSSGSSFEQDAIRTGAATRTDQLAGGALRQLNIAEACGRAPSRNSASLQYARGSLRNADAVTGRGGARPGHAHAIHEIEGRVALVIKTLGA